MNSEKGAQLEKFFVNAIKLALQDQMPWSMLASVLDNVTLSLDQCKQLIKILLEELQILHKQKQVENRSKVMPEMGTSGHTSVAPNRGCSPWCWLMSISSEAFLIN